MINTVEQTILLIEDNPGDSRLIKELLNEITTFDYQLVIVETLNEGCEQIRKQDDIVLILLDLNLPDSTGKQTFETLIKFAEKIPIVPISGLHDVELSLSLIKDGAQDYIPKGDLSSSQLTRVIQFSIERKKLLSELEKKTRQLKQELSNFINRELRMVELKNEVNELAKKLGEKQRYGL
jgi:DNA-binding NtrC family response regulator